MLAELKKDELRDVMSLCYASTANHAKILFSERFDRPFSKSQHPKLFAALDDPSIQKLVVKAPRGFGKTSLINIAYPSKRILFQDAKYIVPISNTATQAVMQSENLKRELMSNIDINKIFGNVKSDIFSKEIWVTSNGIAVMPRGAGQQVRGLLFGMYRPDLIICDDLEDAESVMSEDQRKKLKQWFFADVCNAVNKARKDWRIIVIGTLLHEDSLLANLIEDPDWTAIELDICDDNYNSLWPEYMTTEMVKAEVESYRRQGQLDVFYREFRGLAVAAEDAVFLQSYFKPFEDKKEYNHKLENIVIVDPAKTVKLHSAESGIVGVGLDMKESKIYVRDVIGERFHPDQLYDAAFSMADRIGARVIGIEVTSLNEFITYPIRNEMIKRKRFYEIIELNPRKSKDERVAAMAPFYRMGYMYHNSACCAPLEAQLMAFPRAKRWDIMDALAYFIEMLDVGSRFFESHDFDTDKPDDVEAEYKDLIEEDRQAQRDEKPVDNWRSAP